ncbi:uncharacterized protein LOC129738899 isoform X2 [Uranotaenia lowii]|uniref:uncharacterized protein LOC129738899 isoform X2 n=1 Tax=Uranotaenia lowii TaxID=190385 RepID=UPI00247A6E79|nr:uncharacterized protein LOC129738899 isoform X2 [Uranotaenia lowii]
MIELQDGFYCLIRPPEQVLQVHQCYKYFPFLLAADMDYTIPTDNHLHCPILGKFFGVKGDPPGTRFGLKKEYQATNTSRCGLQIAFGGGKDSCVYKSGNKTSVEWQKIANSHHPQQQQKFQI